MRYKMLLKSIFSIILGTLISVFLVNAAISFYSFTHIPTASNIRDYFIGVMLFSCVIAGLVLVIGLPSQAMLQKYGKTQLVWHIVPAVLVACLIAIFIAPALWQTTLPFVSAYAVLLSFFSWLIRRPDLDETHKALA